MKYFPYKNDGRFKEDDFRWIRDWGFTWVRLPMDYRFWTANTLDVIGTLNSGWVLWNFRGPFGVLDTERPATASQDWYGHKLDRPLLNLLQKKMKA